MANNALPDLDLGELMKQYNIQIAEEKRQMDRIDVIERDFGSSVDTEVEAVKKAARLEGEATSIAAARELEKERRNKEAAAFFGVNPEAHTSIIQELSTQIRQQHTELRQNAEGIKKRMNRSFMESPLEWLVDQFTLGDDVAVHNTGVQIMNRDMEVLEKLGQLADQQIARNNAITANTSAELARLSAERSMLLAEIRVQDARQQAMSTSLQFGSVRLATSQQAFGNMVRIHDAQVQLQHLQLAKGSKELQREQTQLQRKNLQLLIQAKEEDLAARKELQFNLDKATSVLGMRRISVNEYKQAPQKIQNALFEVMSNPSTHEGRLGHNTVNALETAENLNAPLNANLTQIKQMLGRWSSEITADPTYAALKPADRESKLEKHFKKKVGAEAGNIPDVGGLYSAPSLSAVGNIPAAANTILFKSSFAPLAAANKNLPTSAQSIYDAAVNLVADKKIDVDRAAQEIAVIYKSIALDNTQQRDYNRFALPMQNDYRTSINTGAGTLMGLTGARVIDMTNATEVKNAMLRTLSAQKAMGPNMQQMLDAGKVP